MKSAKQDVPSLYRILRTKKKWSQHQKRPLDKKCFSFWDKNSWYVECNLRKKNFFKLLFSTYYSLEYISMGNSSQSFSLFYTNGCWERDCPKKSLKMQIDRTLTSVCNSKRTFEVFKRQMIFQCQFELLSRRFFHFWYFLTFTMCDQHCIGK